METLLQNDTFISSLDWKNRGSLVPVYNKNIFTIDTGGNHENCIVILHGYLSSSKLQSLNNYLNRFISEKKSK